MLELYMGRTADEWLDIKRVYNKLAPVLETPEGERLLLLGELRLAQQQLEQAEQRVQTIIKDLESL